jgi:aspartate dehydrogenase
MRKIGIVGYGKLGKHLCSAILQSEELELAFVWNRNPSAIENEIPEEKKIQHLEMVTDIPCDLIVEVAHPIISKRWGKIFLEHCDYMIGSPTALSDRETEAEILEKEHAHGLYIPRGALPGLEEVLSMREADKIHAASITMRKHPKSLKFSGPLSVDPQKIKGEEIYYQGPLRDLCGYAPNNVNTMAVLALSSGLGMDRVHATLIADPRLVHHITEVSLYGAGDTDTRYSLDLIRKSPAGAGAVTSSATFDSFLASMLRAHGKGTGMHFC